MPPNPHQATVLMVIFVCLYSGAEIRVHLGYRLFAICGVFSPLCRASLSHSHNAGAAEDAGLPRPLQGHRSHSAQVGHTASDTLEKWVSFYCLKIFMKLGLNSAI